MTSHGVDIPRDAFTGAVVEMSSDHEAIHQGIGYTVANSAEGIADDGYLYLELIAPAANVAAIHLKKVIAWCEGGIASFEVVEAPTVTTGITALAPQNRRRTGTPKATTLVVKSNPTGIANGTVIEGPYLFGGGGNGAGQGGLLDSDLEIILKPATTTIIRARNLAGAAKALSLHAFWYEEIVG